MISLKGFCQNSDTSAIVITKFASRILHQDSSWNTKKPIYFKTQPALLTIEFQDKADSINPNFVCVYLEPMMLLDTLKLGKSTIINFNNLAGGDYTLTFINLKNQHQTKIEFSVAFVFWQRWWFVPVVFLISLGILGLIFFLFFRYRLRQKLRTHRLRDNIASDLHDDVGATLSSVRMVSELLRNQILKKKSHDEMLPLIERIIGSATESIETMRGVVWTINPNNENATDFIEKLRNFAQEMLNSRQITLDFEVKGFSDEKLSLEVQRNLFLFFKEAIHNIAKHSEAKTAKVNLVFDEKAIKLSISDNGIGFENDRIYEGQGLKSFRKRAEELEGVLKINSETGKGTQIELYFLT